MKQPILILAFAAAAWLLAQPFLTWMVRWQVEPARFIVECAIAAILAVLVGHASQRRHSNWSAVFAALTVALNPIWPIAAPPNAVMAIGIAGGALVAIYAIRRWE